MLHRYCEIITRQTGLEQKAINNTIKLLESGATIPFISRYRKEQTMGMDEVEVTMVRDEFNKLTELENRKQTIIKTIDEQGLLTDELKQKISGCYNANELEDIYLPFKPKKKSRASKARELGLEPLAKIIMQQKDFGYEEKAKSFLNEDITSVADALQGARDIIAEWVNENRRARKITRILFEKEAHITSKVAKNKEEEGINYKDYFQWDEEIKKCASHRVLALFRGEKEGFLKLSVAPSKARVLDELNKVFVENPYDIGQQVEMAVSDAYTRLLKPSLENEMKNKMKDEADDEAIKVFAVNLRQLLMAPPLGQKNILAIDPGFRTGCKVVCLDKQGNLKHNETIYPHPPQKETGSAMKKINSLISMFKIEAIAIGNGTASRETERFIKKMKFDRDVLVFIVNESGASIYSASPVAREEFPDYDVTVRGAVSIGRRLMDPLSELVKIDPKNIGVGQYQHDVNQQKLKQSLDTVVESCVNNVGVNLNTASKHVLTYVSGLGPTLAENIVKHRKKKGAFKARNDLKAVSRLGDKAFEQAAGFLRIPGSEHPLDNTGVHPESYHIVEQMARDAGCSIKDLINDQEKRAQIDVNNYVSGQTGLPTLYDIMNELSQPGLDPREKATVFEFDPNVKKPEDLQPGMELPGIVTNITNFGAFVDVGVKQDGLVHISELADEFVKNPADVVSLHQYVRVKVLQVDLARKRIGFSIRLAGK
jgi:uncharacterized protein